VKCVQKCQTNLTKCLTSVPATKVSCKNQCVVNRIEAVTGHRMDGDDFVWSGGDAACLTGAQADFKLCKSVCAAAAVFNCRQMAFPLCVAQCPNLSNS
jgi:hypothetical protein